ncbi:hypothetical protein AB1Y20_023261 [Prymnesium parvum]|uniref:CBM20 domain-containing protein n=1 Tax=Prymnesium parvum TaxID=97485 RepID=A0AB34JE74_PRYPA
MLPTHQSFGAHLGSLGSSQEENFLHAWFVPTSFEVRAETRYGDEVRVVGSPPSLGSWNPLHGVRLVTNASLYPVWRCDPLLLNESEVEFKFVIVRADGSIEWEERANRHLPLQGADEAHVIADWNAADGPATHPLMPASPAAAARTPRIGAQATSGTGVKILAPPSTATTRSPGSASTAGAPPATISRSDSGLVERLLVVEHHLPFILTKDESGAWSGKWDDTALLATSVQGGRHLMGTLNIEVLFVGCPQQHVPKESQEEVRAFLAKYNCIPVFLEDSLYKQHGRGYCSTVLWPLLHNQLPERHAGGEGGDGSVVPTLWDAYVKANDAFAHVLIKVIRPGDLIWIHSYPLLLVPSALQTLKVPSTCIVSLFLHTPFPSPEVWRVLPHRTQLLQGMLASHVVGFHLFEYARHFMTSCRRLLGLGENVGAGPAGGVLSIDLGKRLVTITVSHVGIDHDVLQHRLRQVETQQHRDDLLAKCKIKGRTVIGGVEMLNPLQGTLLKLLAYEMLLKDYPMWRSRLTMVQVCFPDKCRPRSSEMESTEIRRVVSRIRSAFGEDSIYYFEVGTELPKEWSVNGRLALFCLLDVLLNCAMRDGLNLLPFEYVLSKATLHQSQITSAGIVVLSEFVGCSHVLNGGIRVNPFNLEHVVEQLDTALSMPINERAARLAKDHKFTCDNTTATWLKVAVHDMRRVRSAATALAPCTRSLRSGQPLNPLPVEAVQRAYSSASHRLILLGFDGTIIQQDKVNQHLKNFQDFSGHSLSPPAAVLICLETLCADPRNVVCVISGRGRVDMEATLGGIKGLGLAAELGFLQRKPGMKRSADDDTQWHRTAIINDSPWRELASPVLLWYTMRTNGSYVKWQESAVQWCYHDADPDFGRFQGRQLTSSLLAKLEGTGVYIGHSHAKCTVEVRLSGVNKGIAADALLSSAQEEAPVDFVLCVGDDDDDEYMLSAMTARVSSPDMRERLLGRSFLVTVGNRAKSHAQYQTNSARDVLSLLELLSGNSVGPAMVEPVQQRWRGAASFTH